MSGMRVISDRGGGEGWACVVVWFVRVHFTTRKMQRVSMWSVVFGRGDERMDPKYLSEHRRWISQSFLHDVHFRPPRRHEVDSALRVSGASERRRSHYFHVARMYIALRTVMARSWRENPNQFRDSYTLRLHRLDLNHFVFHVHTSVYPLRVKIRDEHVPEPPIFTPQEGRWGEFLETLAALENLAFRTRCEQLRFVWIAACLRRCFA